MSKTYNYTSVDPKYFLSGFTGGTTGGPLPPGRRATVLQTLSQVFAPRYYRNTCWGCVVLPCVSATSELLQQDSAPSAIQQDVNRRCEVYVPYLVDLRSTGDEQDRPKL